MIAALAAIIFFKKNQVESKYFGPGPRAFPEGALRLKQSWQDFLTQELKIPQQEFDQCLFPSYSLTQDLSEFHGVIERPSNGNSNCSLSEESMKTLWDTSAHPAGFSAEQYKEFALYQSRGSGWYFPINNKNGAHLPQPPRQFSWLKNERVFDDAVLDFRIRVAPSAFPSSWRMSKPPKQEL